MTDAAIVHSFEPVTLVGGATVSQADLAMVLSLAPTLVAADGGAAACWRAGLAPVAVIGDMDSIDAASAAAFADVLHPVREQETTDFDKALRHIAAPLVLAVGVTGGRLDHELAVLHGLLSHPDRPCIAVGVESLVFLCPRRIAMVLPAGMALSLFPMAPGKVHSTGLVWPTDDVVLSPVGRIGTSNAVADGAVTLAAEEPVILVILPRTALVAVIAALRAAKGWAEIGQFRQAGQN